VVNDSTKPRVQDVCRGGSYENPTKDYNINHPDYNYPPSGFSVPTASDFQHAGNIPNPQSYYNNPASKYMGESETEYPLLQSTFSESSSETCFEQRDAYPPTQHDDGILPPLPSEELYDPPKKIPSGPNPYALKSSGSGGIINYPAFYVTHSYAAPAPPPAIVRPVSVPQPRVVDTSRATSHLPGILQQVHNGMDLDYRSHRLEKQRQNVVGGSLFVTSPRSFLMGCKRSFHE